MTDAMRNEKHFFPKRALPPYPEPTLQIVRMRRAGSSDSLSRGYVMIGAGGYVIWFTYGLSLGNVPLIVCDAVGALMQLAVLWWAYRLDPGPRAA